MVRATRLSAPATAPRAARWFLLGGLALIGAGCITDAPSDAPPKAEAEKGAMEKVEEKVVAGAKKVEEVAGKAVEATGKAIGDAGHKLETDAAESARKNLGEKVGNAVESVGKGMESAGASTERGGKKLEENAAPK